MNCSEEVYGFNESAVFSKYDFWTVILSQNKEEENQREDDHIRQGSLSQSHNDQGVDAPDNN